MRDDVVWAEMARRKVQFHPDAEWDKISLWGLFQWGDVSRYIKSGLLVTDMTRANVTVWVQPSREAWEKHIQPLVERHTLDELLSMAGWDTPRDRRVRA